jgi:hypothetical protein
LALYGKRQGRDEEKDIQETYKKQRIMERGSRKIFIWKRGVVFL